MPALLRVFHAPPPVIKRRARELLDAIRDAVKAHFLAIQVTGAAVVAGADEDVPVLAVPPQNDIRTEKAESSKLWSNRKDVFHSMFYRLNDVFLATSLSTTSSLFGPAALEVKKTSSSLSASTSSLFGVAQPLQGSSEQGGRFQDVLNKIHGSLSIAPFVPQV